MTEAEYEELMTAIANVQGTLEALGFIISLPRFSDEERKRHETLAVNQAAKLKGINARLHEIYRGGQ